MRGALGWGIACSVAGALWACGGEEAVSDGAGGGGAAADDSADDGAPGGAGGTGGSGPIGCAEPTGAGTVHDDYLIEADETWTAEDSPHYVTTSLSIRGATVTVEKCALVVLSEGVGIEVGDSVGEPGVLVTRGVLDLEHEQPVVFTSESDDVYWRNIWIDPTGTADLEGTILRRGADVNQPNANGVVVVFSVLELPVQKRLRMVNSAIVEAAGIGVNLGDYVGFTDDSDNLVIEDVGLEEPAFSSSDTRYPIFTTTAGLATIPRGTYTGNYYDAIRVNGGSRYPLDVTIHDRGVPYDFDTDLHIEPDDETDITFEIEAGSTLRFHDGYGVYLGSGTGTAEAISNPRRVKLLAEGTEAAPITFTSSEATPAAGDWIGVVWGGGPSSGNVMSYVTIDFAGAANSHNGFGCSGSDSFAALLFRNWRPSSAFIENSTFSNSLADGIIEGWDSISSGPNLTGNNTFTNVVRCDVTQPQVNGACPDSSNLPNCY
ncbi:MAG TPA: hypothetical protein VLC09_18695 [Polyangiaceae bacterium]|nr:hypothetical protein [Polyangiaceae bacterium]